jgi:hypothetical protein
MADDPAGPKRPGDALRKAIREQELRSGPGRSASDSPSALARMLAQKQVEHQDELEREAIKWLIERWGTERPCPYCSNPQWRIGTPVEFLLVSGEATAPHFPVLCTNCGNTVLINAVHAGIVPDPADG